MPHNKKKTSQTGLSFESYGQTGPFEAERASLGSESIQSLLTKLKFSSNPHSNYPPPPGMYQDPGDEQAYPFKTQKNILREFRLYIFVALLTAVLSGGVFFLILKTYSLDKKINEVRAAPKERQTGSGLSIHQPGFVLHGEPLDRASEDVLSEPDVQSPALHNGSAYPAPIVTPQPNTDHKTAIYEIGQAKQTGIPDPRNAPEPIPRLESGESAPGHQSTQISSLKPASKTAQPLETERLRVEDNQTPAVANKSAAKLRPEEEAKMLTRASDLMKQNDVASARLIYKYLEEHGSVAAKSLYESTSVAGTSR